MALTLQNIKPAQAIGLTGDVQFPYDQPFSVVDYIQSTFVEPVKQPIDPNLPMIMQENGVDINTASIASAVAFALYRNDITAVQDITSFYKQIIYEMTGLPALHPNKWLVDWARERVNKRIPYPRPDATVQYTIDSDLIPECKNYLLGQTNQDNIVSSFAYIFNVDTLGVAFRTAADFDQFLMQFDALTKAEAQNTTMDTKKQIKQFLKIKLSKLTSEIAVRNDIWTDNNEPYSFAQLLRYSLDNYLAANANKGFYIPFTTSQLFAPKSIVFINVENHAHSDKNTILKNWNRISNSLKQPIKLWSKNDIKKLDKVATTSAHIQSQIKQLDEAKADDTQRDLNLPLSKTPPSTEILQKRVIQIIKKASDTNRSMNVYKQSHRTYARPNRRDPDNIDKSGFTVSTKYRPDIHIYQDTSGSISEDNYEAATLMLIDLAVKLNVDLYYTSFSHIMSEPTKIQVKGRSKKAIYQSIKRIPKVTGGTNFKNVWDIINHNQMRQKQISFMITDMEYYAPSTETQIPKTLYYLPIANIPWQYIQHATECFLKSTKYYKQNIRRNILY